MSYAQITLEESHKIFVSKAIDEIKKGNPLDKICQRYGDNIVNEARALIKQQPIYGTISPQQFHSKQEKERREYFRNRTIEGKPALRVNQQDHNTIIQLIFESINSGTKPNIRSILENRAKQQHYDPLWAKKVTGHMHKKKMRETLELYKDNELMHDLRSEGLLSQTYKSALLKSTYSGFTDMLFSGTQLIRKKRALQQENDDMNSQLKILKAEVTKMNAQIDKSENWKLIAREMYNDGESYNAIKNKTGKSKTTVHDYIKRLIKENVLANRNCSATNVL